MQVIDNREKFEETTSTGNVVIQFSAGWCQPCKVLSRTMTSVTPGHSDVSFYKVDIDSMDKALISHYNVRSVPRLLMFVNGEDDMGAAMSALEELKIPLDGLGEESA